MRGSGLWGVARSRPPSLPGVENSSQNWCVGKRRTTCLESPKALWVRSVVVAPLPPPDPRYSSPACLPKLRAKVCYRRTSASGKCMVRAFHCCHVSSILGCIHKSGRREVNLNFSNNF